MTFWYLIDNIEYRIILLLEKYKYEGIQLKNKVALSVLTNFPWDVFWLITVLANIYFATVIYLKIKKESL